MNNDLQKLELRGKQLVQNFIKFEKKLPKNLIAKDLKRILEKQIVILDTTMNTLILLIKLINNKN